MLALLLALGSHAAPSSSTTPTTAAGLARLTAAVGSLEARLTAAAQHSVGVAASVAAAAATSAASSALSSIVAQQTDAQTHQLAAAFAAGGRAAAAAAAASTSSYGASAGGGGGSGAFRPPDLPDGSYSSYSALLQQKQQQPQQYQPRSPSQQQQRPSGSQFAASAAPNFSGDNAAVSSSPGLPLSRGEVDAAAMLSELAPFDTDGGGGGERGAVVSTLGDFLPPSASAVAGLLHRASSSMRRALCELGELRAAWAASRRGMFSVPSGFAAERAAWVGGGARDDEDSSGDLDDVYDLDELEGGAGYASSGTLQFGGRHAGAAAASAVASFSAESGADMMDEGEGGGGDLGADGGDEDYRGDDRAEGAAPLSSSSAAAPAPTRGNSTSYSHPSSHRTNAGAGGGGGRDGVGRVVTLGEGRFALETAVANAALRSRVRQLEVELAASNARAAQRQRQQR